MNGFPLAEVGVSPCEQFLTQSLTFRPNQIDAYFATKLLQVTNRTAFVVPPELGILTGCLAVLEVKYSMGLEWVATLAVQVSGNLTIFPIELRCWSSQLFCFCSCCGSLRKVSRWARVKLGIESTPALFCSGFSRAGLSGTLCKCIGSSQVVLSTELSTESQVWRRCHLPCNATAVSSCLMFSNRRGALDSFPYTRRSTATSRNPVRSSQLRR